MARFMKHIKNGRIFPWHVGLEDNENLVEVDIEGDTLVKVPEVEAMDIRDQIEKMRKRDDIIDLGAQYDIGFDDKLKAKEMKFLLCVELVKKGIIKDPTDEELEYIRSEKE